MSVPRVFISHSSTDAVEALQLAEALDAFGVPSWIAPRDVPVGTDFAEAVMTALRGAEAVALLLSSSALKSDHVHKEMTVSVGHRRVLLVFATTDALTRVNELPDKWHLLLADTEVKRYLGADVAAADIEKRLGSLDQALRDLGAEPKIVALVKSVTARNAMYHEYVRTSGYISLRRAKRTPVVLFVYKARVRLSVTPALARNLRAQGIGAVEEVVSRRTQYVKITAGELASPTVRARVEDILTGERGVEPPTRETFLKAARERCPEAEFELMRE